VCDWNVVVKVCGPECRIQWNVVVKVGSADTAVLWSGMTYNVKCVR